MKIRNDFGTVGKIYGVIGTVTEKSVKTGIIPVPPEHIFCVDEKRETANYSRLPSSLYTSV